MLKSENNSLLNISSILAQAGCSVDPSTGGIVQPIHLATTFERDVDGAYSRGYMYGRQGSPNRTELSNILAQIEGGKRCFMYSSGMSAASAILLTLKPGSSVLLPHDVYYGVTKLINETPGISVNPIYADFRRHADVADALSQKVAMVWIETPSNPLNQITDIRKISAMASEAGATTVVDSTWTTPLLQRPFDLGADIVFHSVTKYLSGHSDVLGGAVICKESNRQSDLLDTAAKNSGNVLDPFSCWLTMRGLRTLPLRMQRHCDNAEAIAEFLLHRKKVEIVHYPGLKDDPGFTVASQQMDRFGAMISFRIVGGADEAIAFVGKTKLHKRATSLGATESLIEHRASSEGPDSKTPQNLIRISVGIEDAGDLIKDLDQAFI